MAEMDEYKSNCDYIRKTFSLPESTSLYALVNKITEEYKTLKDKLFIEENKEEVKIKSTEVEPSQKEKKRGRPRKDRDSN